MASYEEYAKKYLPSEGEDQLEAEQAEATNQESERPQNVQFEDSTQDVDWENRYKELEKLNSRQAQDLGNYRKLVDDYIQNPTPANDAVAVNEEPPQITVDDLYDDPNAAITRAVESHPAIREAKEIKAKLEVEAAAKEFSAFTERHGDFQDIAADPAFKNWVFENQTRLALAQTADRGDLTAADALFSLYKAERGLSQSQNSQEQAEAVAQASLQGGYGAEPPAPDTYSRSEMLEQKIRAKQGDQAAERYVNSHAAAYRKALGSGNVRD
jgi:hypothetical protein